MDEKVRKAIEQRVESEPFAQKFGLQLTALGLGYSRVEMTFTPDMENMFGMAHGGAIFALMDEAFETASNSHGNLAVALNMTVHYVAPATPGSRLIAEAREISATRRTANYDIKVRDEDERLIAFSTAVVYPEGHPPSFPARTFLTKHSAYRPCPLDES